MGKPERRSQTIGYAGSYVAIGLATAVLGPTLPGLAGRTGSQLGQVSVLFAAMSLGYLAGALMGGRLYDRVPGHPLMTGSLAVMAAALALTPTVSHLGLLAAVVLLLGVATATVDVGGNALLVWVYGRSVGPYMNALHFFFGFGSLLAPIIVGQALTLSGDIGWAYWILAMLMLPAGLWLLRVPSPAAPAGPARSPGDPPQAQTGERWLLALIVLLFFLYVGAEAAFGGWIYTYAVAMGLSDEATAAYLTSTFWGALTVGRLLAVPIAARVRPRWILIAELAGCLASVGILLLWTGSRTATWLGASGMGLSMAAIFPTLISLAERRMIISGQVAGWFLAGSSVGGMTLPWLIGQLFESRGPQSTMVVIAVDLLAAMGVLALLLYSSRRLSPSSELVYNGDGK